VPPQKRVILLRWPMGGLVKRRGYQQQPPYSTPDALNVRPDGTIEGRERGGSRPGLAKAFSEQLGSGSPVRMLTDVSYVESATHKTRIAAVAGGILHREEPAGTMAAVTHTDFPLRDVDLMAADHLQKLYIADWDTGVQISGTDGVLSSSKVLTSASVGNWETAGAVKGMAVRITGGGTGADEKIKIKLVGSPTGGTFTLKYVRDVEAVSGTEKRTDQSAAIAYDASAATMDTELEKFFGSSELSVSLASSEYTVTFDGSSYTGKNMATVTGQTDYLILGANDLTGGTFPHVTFERVTVGGAGATVGAYEIASISGTDLTLSGSPGESTGSVEFELERAPKKWDPATNAVSSWVASEGEIPLGNPLFVIWKERAVLAGDPPHAWYMSRAGDLEDFDFSQDDRQAAVYGVTGEAGRPGEPIRALMPHSDDCLVIGCHTSMWVIRGDPAAGGTMDRLSSRVGVVDRHAWTHAPGLEGSQEILVFLSHDGLWAMASTCGSPPISLSRERLPEELLAVDWTASTVTLEYCDRYRGISIAVVADDESTGTYYWFDWETKSFWPESYTTEHEPTVRYRRRDHVSDHSRVLWGGRDGYLRRHQADTEDDDGTNFTSYVEIGPLRLGRHDMETGSLAELQATVAAGSGDVGWELRGGLSSEDAFDQTAGAHKRSGTWTVAGLNPANHPRLRAAAAVLRLTGTAGQKWALEALSASVRTTGRRRYQ